ncbi:hypothetical protein J6590_080926 [Homalodisca vitripennis]|nr:hypothetical protein J6590_080926 [Homalodisca vitripennis]
MKKSTCKDAKPIINGDDAILSSSFHLNIIRLPTSESDEFGHSGMKLSTTFICPQPLATMAVAVEDSSKTADNAESTPACAGQQSRSGIMLSNM